LRPLDIVVLFELELMFELPDLFLEALTFFSDLERFEHLPCRPYVHLGVPQLHRLHAFELKQLLEFLVELEKQGLDICESILIILLPALDIAF
jgi:hypothetical protein